jgi:hypothetical protein
VATLDFYDKLLIVVVVPVAVIFLLGALPMLVLEVQNRFDYSDPETSRVVRNLRRRKILRLVVFAL